MIDYYRPVGGECNEILQSEFENPAAALVQIEREVDIRANTGRYATGRRVVMQVSSEQLTNDRFTNVYDLSFTPHSTVAKIRVASDLRTVAGFLADVPEAMAAASGAFLFLTDRSSGAPRQPALNLALQENGHVLSLPVVDRETLLANTNGELSVRYIRAYGELLINGELVTWSGSRTKHPADCSVFGNGNVVIRHAENDERGARKQRIRILDEFSRLTPPILTDTQVDAGLLAKAGGHFQVAGKSSIGGLDLFAYDVVLRCNPHLLRGDGRDDIQLLLIDTLIPDESIQGAVSVGPFLNDGEFSKNPINNDPSLGSDPPFIDVPMVRLAVYESADERIHIRLFDGRPESSEFRGVTPFEAVSHIFSESEVLWGCFLDPGRTAKIVTRSGADMMSYGNAHYLQWPKLPGGSYTWVPSAGRPIPSALIMQ
jgi:hypothetical protein